MLTDVIQNPIPPQEVTTLAYPLRVGYDAYAFVSVDKGTGKGKQLKNILGRYLHSFIGYAPASGVATDLPLLRQGTSKHSYLAWQQLRLPSLLRRDTPEVFLAPYNAAPVLLPRKSKLVLVLHDLIPMERFDNVPWRRRFSLLIWRMLIRWSARRSHTILTVSEFSRQEILKTFPGSRVEVISCTIPESWFDREAFVPIAQRGNYLFIVTSPDPHRNLDRALQAYADYAKVAGPDAAQLRIGGVSNRAAIVREKIERLSLQDRTVIEPYLSDAEMQSRVRRARAIYMPSLVEGFGIPVLEGMACGTPILCSNITSLPEVGGDAPVYFDPTSVSEMTEALMRVLSDECKQESMALAGMERARVYHPQAVGETVDRFWDTLAKELSPV
jgi:glycosyltransferase involved in cell wall biosynthesis